MQRNKRVHSSIIRWNRTINLLLACSFLLCYLRPVLQCSVILTSLCVVRDSIAWALSRIKLWPGVDWIDKGCRWSWPNGQRALDVRVGGVRLGTVRSMDSQSQSYVSVGQGQKETGQCQRFTNTVIFLSDWSVWKRCNLYVVFFSCTLINLKPRQWFLEHISFIWTSLWKFCVIYMKFYFGFRYKAFKMDLVTSAHLDFSDLSNLFTEFVHWIRLLNLLSYSITTCLVTKFSDER